MPKKRTRKMTNAEKLKRFPQHKKGSLRPPGSIGKGDADSRVDDWGKRRATLGNIFGENCPNCGSRSKNKCKRTVDGVRVPYVCDSGALLYWCDTCKDYFEAI